MVKANAPSLHSWVEIAVKSDFPIQNLPFGIFQTADRDPRIGVAIGECVLDLCVVAQHNMFELIDLDPNVFHRPSLHDFLALGRPVWRAVRNRVSELLRNDNDEIAGNSDLIRECLVKQSDVEMLLPVPTAYSLHSEKRNAFVGATPTPAAALPPASLPEQQLPLLPVGSPVRRPSATSAPFAPTGQLDFELEVGLVLGKEVEAGKSISPAEAEEHIFGIALCASWLARDVAAPEQVTVSPWVVPLDALEPYRVRVPEQSTSLPALEVPGGYAYDVHVEALLHTAEGLESSICHSNLKYAASIPQILAMLGSAGAPFGSLCLTGPLHGEGACSSMLEQSVAGSQPITLADGTPRHYLHDFDTVVVRGYAEKNNVRLGFGDTRTPVLPAV